MKQLPKLSQLGWIIAAVVAVSFSALGFQPAGEKTGVIDLNRVIQQSDLGKQNTTDLNTALLQRRQLMDFVNTYKVLTTEQAQRMRELMLKPNAPEAEKAALEKIRQDVMESDRKSKELQQKQNLTDADRTVLQDFAQRTQVMAQVLERWNSEFTEELQKLESDLRDQTITKAKASLGEVAKAGSFTVVHEATVTPYGANDLTDATIKAMNAKK